MRIGAAVLVILAAGGGTVHAYDDAVLLKGRAAAAALNETLAARMTRSLRESGAERTISVCAWVARALSDEVRERDGVTVRRTALRLRNKANAPDDYEQAVLARFVADFREGTLPDELLDEHREGGRKVYRYSKPLVATPLCIKCHGRTQDISDEVRKVLDARYPDDAATGYKEGDLIGIVSVILPER